MIIEHIIYNRMCIVFLNYFSIVLSTVKCSLQKLCSYSNFFFAHAGTLIGI